MNLSCTYRAPIPKILPRICLTYSHPSLTVERLRRRPAGFICINTSTRREPSAFKQNTGYTTRGHGRRGHGCRPRCGRGRRPGVGAGAGAGAGVGAGAGASAGMLIEVAVPK